MRKAETFPTPIRSCHSFHPSVDMLRIRVVHSWNDSSQGKKGLPTTGYTCLVLPWGVRRGAPWLPVASVFPFSRHFRPSIQWVAQPYFSVCLSIGFPPTLTGDSNIRGMENGARGERNDRGNDSLQPNRLCQVIMQKLSGWKILAFLLMFINVQADQISLHLILE